MSDGIQSYVVSVSTIDKNESAILQSIIDYDTVINSKEVTNPTIRTLAENAKQILNVKNKSNIDAKGQALVQGTQDLSKNSDQLKAGAKAVSDGTSTLKNSTSEMNELIKNIATLKDGLSAVKQGSETLSNGESTLKNGTNQVLNGSQSLEQGLQTLSSSSGNVKEALNQLDEGSKSAVDGSKRLLDGVKTFKTEINNGLEKSKVELSKLNGLNDFVSEPVVINEEPYGEVDSYGIAFTPLFLSIGLWVGALMCYVVLYYDQKHRFGKFDYTYKNKLAQNLLYIAIGIVEGIVTGLLLKLGLEFNVANMGIYIAECAIVGAIFMTIIQFLIRNFGDIGKFLALIILVLQLAASGGTFPVETIDKGFRFFNPLLPMTYSIKIFKECLVQTSNNFIGKNTLILVLIGLALGTITLIVEIVKHKGNSKKEIENNNEKVTGVYTMEIIHENEYVYNMNDEIEPYLATHRQEGYIPGAEDHLHRKDMGKVGIIHVQRYLAEKPKGVIIISHGFTEAAPKYDEMIYYFLKAGYHVYMPEHMGHGQSYRLTADSSLVHIDTWKRYVRDFLKISD